MVQHLEWEIELNGFATTDNTSITGVHSIEPSPQQQQKKPPKQREHALGAAIRDIYYETAAKPTGTNDPNEPIPQHKPHRAKHAAK